MGLARIHAVSRRSRALDRLIAHHRRLLDEDLRARAESTAQKVEARQEETAERAQNGWKRHQRALDVAGSRDDATLKNRKAWKALEERRDTEDTLATEEDARQRLGKNVLGPTSRPAHPELSVRLAQSGQPIDGIGRRSIPRRAVRRPSGLSLSGEQLAETARGSAGPQKTPSLGARTSGALPFRRHAHAPEHGVHTFD